MCTLSVNFNVMTRQLNCIHEVYFSNVDQTCSTMSFYKHWMTKKSTVYPYSGPEQSTSVFLCELNCYSNNSRLVVSIISVLLTFTKILIEALTWKVPVFLRVCSIGQLHVASLELKGVISLVDAVHGCDWLFSLPCISLLMDRKNRNRGLRRQYLGRKWNTWTKNRL